MKTLYSLSLILSLSFFISSFNGIEKDNLNNRSSKSNLDTLSTKSTLEEENNTVLFNQYNKLQNALKKYKKIAAEDSWKPMTLATPYKDIRPDEKSITVAEIRNRLFIMGDLKNDSKSDFYDQELMDGVMKYKLRNGLKPNYIITEDHIKDLNESIEEKIRRININMERCKSISQKLLTNKEYIMVNVPSYELVYVKNGKIELESKVFVGAPLTKTTIFDGNIDKVVFSPYWTVPQSIVDN
ncbi:L,D-transpeptidase, partial [Flavobacterium sp. HMWF030]